MTTKNKTGGLAGVSAGATALCTVGQEGAGLTYRGYDIYDLSDNANFEEVAHLLLYGHLPNQAELDAYIDRIKSLRGLPDQVKQVLEMIPADAQAVAMGMVLWAASSRAEINLDRLIRVWDLRRESPTVKPMAQKADSIKLRPLKIRTARKTSGGLMWPYCMSVCHSLGTDSPT